MQCKQYLYRVSFHKLNNLLILNVYITHLWNNRCSYFCSKEGYFASIFSFPGIYISFYANRRHIQVVETVNDRWMWLKSYKLFKNLTERNVPRELFENWKTLTCDVNAVPLCSTLQYVLAHVNNGRCVSFRLTNSFSKYRNYVRLSSVWNFSTKKLAVIFPKKSRANKNAKNHPANPFQAEQKSASVYCI